MLLSATPRGYDTGPKRSEPVWDNDYALNPRVGISLGVADGTTSGTLGFFVRATVGSQTPRYFAVTCSHVLSPESRSIFPLLLLSEVRV